MQLDEVKLMTADTTVINYIKEIQNNYEQRIKELELTCLKLKEENNLLLYKKFARSAEQLIVDKKQPLLFIEEGTKTSSEKNHVEFTEVKSHKRGKKGRKVPAVCTHLLRQPSKMVIFRFNTL